MPNVLKSEELGISLHIPDIKVQIILLFKEANQFNGFNLLKINKLLRTFDFSKILKMWVTKRF